MISTPASLMAADQNDLNPSIDHVSRLIAWWSRSTILFRYLTWPSPMLVLMPRLSSSSAAALALLWSMVIFAGLPHWSMDLRKKRAAALQLRFRVGSSIDPRLLSDNGPSYLSAQLESWLAEHGMTHTRGKHYHPMTQGKIERCHRSMKNEILLENYYLPGQLKARLAAAHLNFCLLAARWKSDATFFSETNKPYE
jgi:hypothetical protein